MNNIIKHKYKLFFVVFFTLWFFNGMTAFMTLAKWNIFWSHQFDSANIVLSDLIIDDSFPEYSANFMGILNSEFASNKALNSSIKINNSFSGNFADFMSKLDLNKTLNSSIKINDDIYIYISNIGLQSILLRPFFQLGTQVIFKDDPYSWWNSYRFTQVVVAFATAITLALLLTFLAIEFGLFSVSVMGVWVLITNVWITIFARNIYWMPWSWFLPMLCSAYFIYKDKEKLYKYMYGLVFISIAIKASMGYEYITTIMVMTNLPVFYFAITREWSWKKFNTMFFKLALACILGLISVLIIHTFLLGGIDTILQRLYWRTINTDLTNTITNIYTSYSFVLKPYFFDSAGYGIPFIFSVFIGVTIIFIRLIGYRFRVVTELIGTGVNINPQKVVGLYIIIILAFLGAMSHHIIFKQHSGVHTTMNFVLWFMPFWFLMILGIILRPASFKEFLAISQRTPLLQFFIRNKK